jgi:hypothetical protein
MGGLMLRHPEWDWRIIALSRADDPDRAPRFHRAGEAYGARVAMSDLDDSPVLKPLSQDLREIRERIEDALTVVSGGSQIRNPQSEIRNGTDLVFTHGAAGEYTRHERHEQVHRAVREMWEIGQLSGDIPSFAYTDEDRTHPPEPAPDALIRIMLTPEEYARKQEIIRGIYGFREDSFETKAAGPVEAFTTPADPETIVRLRIALLGTDH